MSDEKEIKIQVARRPDHFKKIDKFVEEYHSWCDENDDEDEYTIDIDDMDDFIHAVSYTLMVADMLDRSYTDQEADVYKQNKLIDELFEAKMERDELKAKAQALEIQLLNLNDEQQGGEG